MARTLEKRWNERLVDLQAVRAKAEEAVAKGRALSEQELSRIIELARDLRQVWEAQSTDNRDRKRLLRCLIEEVQLRTEARRYRVLILWKGGATSEREVVRRAAGKAHCTPEDTVELVKKLAAQFDDAQIARVLNRQGRRTGNGNPFTKEKVKSLRGHRGILQCPQKKAQDPPEGPFTADEAASELGVNLSTLMRWLQEGVLAGERMMPGAPWRIVLTDEVRRGLSGGDAPQGWVSLSTAAKRQGLTTSHASYCSSMRPGAAIPRERSPSCWAST